MEWKYAFSDSFTVKNLFSRVNMRKLVRKIIFYLLRKLGLYSGTAII